MRAGRRHRLGTREIEEVLSGHPAAAEVSVIGVRDQIGAIATPHAIHFVGMLPKTRSGKIMRRVLRAVYQGDTVGDLSTIEDDATVDMVREAIAAMRGER